MVVLVGFHPFVFLVWTELESRVNTHRFQSAFVDHREGPVADEVLGVELVDADRGLGHPRLKLLLELDLTL